MIISCIIVTKDRPQELQRCLETLRQQSRRLDQIIVVEGGTSRLVDTTGIDYQTTSPGITRQRNVARGLVRADCDIVIYLDDDAELAPDTIEQVQQTFSAHPQAVGVTGQMNGESSHGLFKRFFGRVTLLYTPQPFGITLGLFNIINRPTRAQLVDWLPGAFMCYRWAAVKDLPFDEWFAAYGLGEDLDFSLQVRTRGQLWVNPAIKINHYHSPVGRDWQKFGYMRIVNRNYLRKKHFLGWGYLVGMWWANGWLLVFNSVRACYSKRARLELSGVLEGIRTAY